MCYFSKTKYFRPESLREKFSAYGDVGDVYIPRNYGTNEPRGFAFVRFIDKRDAEDAQRALDGAEIDGREIRIQEVRKFMSWLDILIFLEVFKLFISVIEGDCFAVRLAVLFPVIPEQKFYSHADAVFVLAV